MAINPEKFSSQMDRKVLEQLREYAGKTNRNISDILTEAVADHLKRVLVRPVFRRSVEVVLDENEELLRRLAK